MNVKVTLKTVVFFVGYSVPAADRPTDDPQIAPVQRHSCESCHETEEMIKSRILCAATMT